MFKRRSSKKYVKRGRRASRTVRRVRRTARRVPAIRAMVRNEVSRAAEIKSVQYGSPYGVPSYFSTADSTTFNPDGFMYCLPGTFAGQNIAIGGQEGQRIGNSVKTKSLILTAVFNPSSYNIGTNGTPAPTEVVMWLFKLKPNITDTIGLASAIAQGSFFQSNLGNVGMSGQLSDLLYPVNPGQITLLGMRRFKLGNSAIGNSGASAGDQHFHNNDFKYNHKLVWNLTKHCPKNLTWDDTAATEPAQRKLWIVMQALRADGTPTNPSWIKTVDVNYRFTYRYTDA